MNIAPSRDVLTPVHSSRDTFTYERFFGLREKPFSLSSDPRFLYPSRSHAVAFDELLAGIRRREGLLVLTGDIGTGKTTLCRAVLRHLDRKTFSAFIPDPFASREDLLKMLLIEFGVLSIQDLANGPLKNASRTELNYLLAGFLESLAPLEAFVVMFIDEAQNMSLPMIEEIRILSDTYGQTGQLQVVFVGQLELHAKLKLPEMRQVDQRVTAYCRLEPLSADAVVGYVQHRLEVAGGTADRVMFTNDVYERLHTASGGVPRVINRICDRALHLAYLRRAPAVDRTILDAALLDIGHTDAPSALLAPQAPQAPQAPSAPKAPLAPSDTFIESVDEWLTRAESHPKLEIPVDALDLPRDVFPSARADAPPAPAVEERREGVRPALGWRPYDDEVRSQRYMQKLGRKWGFRFGVAALAIVAVNVAVAAASYLPTDVVVGTVELPFVADAPTPFVPGVAIPAMPEPQPQELQSATPAPASEAPAPPPARMVTGGRFHVAVGLFRLEESASRLVADLKKSGLPAFHRNFKMASERLTQQVLLGPYEARSEAQADLNRLHEIGGFDDAVVIEVRATAAAGEPAASLR